MKPHIAGVCVFFLVFLFTLCQARIYKSKIENDTRPYFPLTTYGYLPMGYLNISLRNFTFHSNVTSELFGLTFERGQNTEIVVDENDHTQNLRENAHCGFHETKTNDTRTKEDHRSKITNIILFHFNLKNRTVEVNCSAGTNVANVLIFRDIKPLLDENGKDVRSVTSTNGLNCTKKFELPLTVENGSYGTQFALVVANSKGKDLYSLGYYSCANYDRENHTRNVVGTSFEVDIVERNVGSYLSAGDIPLPYIYAIMSIMFALLAILWTFTLRESEYPVVHYLMLLVVILKAVALLFHGITYYYMSESGEFVATWPTPYYVTKVLRGAMLFVVMILIVWVCTYIRNVLSPFMERLCAKAYLVFVNFVVPEYIIDGKLNEGYVEYGVISRMDTNIMYFDMFSHIVVALLMMWSLFYRHDDADGRQESRWRITLVVIGFINHFSRVMASTLLEQDSIIPFQYTWWPVLIIQTGSLIFFVVIGYAFRPNGNLFRPGVRSMKAGCHFSKSMICFSRN